MKLKKKSTSDSIGTDREKIKSEAGLVLKPMINEIIENKVNNDAINCFFAKKLIKK
jgi:hypothetical protein